MKSITSGSSDTLISSMHFMKSGELIIEGVDMSDVSANDITALQLTQEFILYALDRDDWMTEFFSIIDKIKRQSSQRKPDLVLIKGGLEEA